MTGSDEREEVGLKEHPVSATRWISAKIQYYSPDRSNKHRLNNQTNQIIINIHPGRSKNQKYSPGKLEKTSFNGQLIQDVIEQINVIIERSIGCIRS